MQDETNLSAAELLIRAAEFHAAGKFSDALQAYDRIIELDPRSARGFRERGDVLTDLGRLEPAVASYDRAIELDPTDADAHDFRGVALAQLNRLPEALASLERALTLKPGDANALGNRGGILMQLQRPAEALASFDRAIALRPDFTAAHINRGNALLEIERARNAFRRGWRTSTPQFKPPAAQRNGAAKTASPTPDTAEACYDRGIGLANLGRLDQALAEYDRAIALNPDFAQAYFKRSLALKDLDRFEAAIDSYDQALALDPAMEDGHGTRLMMAMELCRWENFQQQVDRVSRKIETGAPVAFPLSFLSVNDNADLQKKCSETYTNFCFSKAPSPIGDNIHAGKRSASATSLPTSICTPPCSSSPRPWKRMTGAGSN